jgi:histone H3
MPAPDGVALRAALEATCLRGALPPVDLRAVCFVRAITDARGKREEREREMREREIE